MVAIVMPISWVETLLNLMLIPTSAAAAGTPGHAAPTVAREGQAVDGCDSVEARVWMQTNCAPPSTRTWIYRLTLKLHAEELRTTKHMNRCTLWNYNYRGQPVIATLKLPSSNAKKHRQCGDLKPPTAAEVLLRPKAAEAPHAHTHTTHTHADGQDVQPHGHVQAYGTCMCTCIYSCTYVWRYACEYVYVFWSYFLKFMCPEHFMINLKFSNLDFSSLRWTWLEI